jgi:hypothetical protein
LEEKNLLRQNFAKSDVGKPKAAVLAQRYGKAYNMNVVPVIKYADGTRDLFKETPGADTMQQSMVIMCVDSASARRAVLNTIDACNIPSDPSQATFVIDSGNEDTFGQVKFFTWTALIDPYEYVPHLTLPKLSPIQYEINFMPVDFAFYDTLVDTPARGSCADLDQTLAINNFMAADIMGIVQAYYYNQGFTFNTLSKSLDGANETSYNSIQAFKRLIVDTTKYGNHIGRHNASHWGYVKKDNSALFGRSVYPLAAMDIFEAYISETRRALKNMNADVPVAPTKSLQERVAEAKLKKSVEERMIRASSSGPGLSGLVESERRIRAQRTEIMLDGGQQDPAVSGTFIELGGPSSVVPATAEEIVQFAEASQPSIPRA